MRHAMFVRAGLLLAVCIVLGAWQAHAQGSVEGAREALQEDMVADTMRAALESSPKEAVLVPLPGLAQAAVGDTLELADGTRVRLVDIDTPEAAPADACLAVSSSDPGAVLQRWTVTRIIDGDTFVLSDSTRVRLIGIDAPEMRPRDRDAEFWKKDKETIRAMGLQSKAYAEELALDKTVELEYGSGNRTDWYGRTVAYVWVLDEQGQRLYRVNDRMIADGYANIYSQFPFAYSDEYREYHRQALEERRGLWGD